MVTLRCTTRRDVCLPSDETLKTWIELNPLGLAGEGETHFIAATLTMTLGLASSSLNRWLCSINLLSLSSCMVALFAREDILADGTERQTMRQRQAHIG